MSARVRSRLCGITGAFEPSKFFTNEFNPHAPK